jgi:hypothetical protein
MILVTKALLYKKRLHKKLMKLTSGRPLKFIEAFMAQEVLPSYSDQSMTTISNVTALQTALYLDEAK